MFDSAYAQTKELTDNSKVAFLDVKKGDWFYRDVMELTKRGLISGYSNQTFKPNDKIRVDEFIKILISALNKDVKTTQNGYWATSYIEKAEEQGIIDNEEFMNYSRNITRGEMAKMIVRATEQSKDINIALNIPDNYKDYSTFITDFHTLSPQEKELALKIYTAGIITGFSDGSFGYHKEATRAEASAIMVRFLERERRKVPVLPETVDFSNTVSVEEFTIQLLEAIGQKATMDEAFHKGYIRYEAEYPTYQKPILRREAALTMARVMDDLTGMSALFTTGENDLFTEGHTLNHRLQPYDIDILVNQTSFKYLTLLDWEDYRGHIEDIQMVTEEYQKEMVTLYLAGLIDTDNQELKPYDFLTKEEAKQWIRNIKEYSSLDQTEVLTKLAKQIQDLDKKPMPEPEIPSNAELWGEIYPYVDKRLYEYPIPPLSQSLFQYYNIDMYQRHFSTLKTIPQVFKNYFNLKYTVDYRNLDAVAPYYSTFNDVGGIGDYRTRSLFFYNPAHVFNHEEKDKTKWILPEDVVDKDIKNIKKHKIVSQAELITHKSLLYNEVGINNGRGTLRIIFYPPTDPNYLKSLGLEVGKWYEKDVFIWMEASIDGPKEYRYRWEHSYLGTPVIKDLSEYRVME